jgi:hypothetical protein
MPVPDKDYGMVWQGFNPSVLQHKTPKETYTSVPFRFGGSNVRLYAPVVKSAKVKK